MQNRFINGNYFSNADIENVPFKILGSNIPLSYGFWSVEIVNLLLNSYKRLVIGSKYE